MITTIANTLPKRIIELGNLDLKSFGGATHCLGGVEKLRRAKVRPLSGLAYLISI